MTLPFQVAASHSYCIASGFEGNLCKRGWGGGGGGDLQWQATRGSACTWPTPPARPDTLTAGQGQLQGQLCWYLAKRQLQGLVYNPKP